MLFIDYLAIAGVMTCLLSMTGLAIYIANSTYLEN